MTTGLRRILIVGAALLMLAALLVFRLDTGFINSRLEQELLHFSDKVLKVESSSLSFMHGIGLKLERVSLDTSTIRMQAGHINVNLRLLPLLLGKVEVEELDIHDAVITIDPQSLQLSSETISSLPVERIHLIRSTVQTGDGHKILTDLHLELRDIGSNRETKWELQAQQEYQSISGHGRLNFHAGQIKNGFGKLKLEQVPFSRIQPVLPVSLHKFINPDAGTVSGSLTLDIDNQNDWAVFGELKLLTNSGKEPIRIRGKLSHPQEGLLQWQDSFIHLSNNAVMAIDGECRQEKCSTQLKADNIELETWASLAPQGIKFHHQLSGQTELDAKIHWDNEIWQGEIVFNLKKGYYHFNGNDIELPELQLYTNNITGDASSWQVKARLTAPGIDGNMRIDSTRLSSGQKNMSIVAEDVDARFWQPLANLMLASLDIDPKLKASGKINGRLQLQQSEQKRSLQLMLDAGAARLAFPLWLIKPQDIPARCNAEFHWQENSLSRFKLDNCQLDSSSIKHLQWSTDKQKQRLHLNKLAINFDQLKNRSITLSEQLSIHRGFIEGSGILFRKHQDSAQWLPGVSGNWRLQNFGTEHWHANGTIQAKDGRLSTQRLLFDGMYGQAELRGNLSFADKRGSIDLISAKLNWNQYPLIPEFWQELVLNGNIEHATVNLLQNSWQAIKAGYVWKQGKLKLKNLNTSIAGGELSAQTLSLQPQENSLAIHGKLRLKEIQLHKLNGIHALLQAELKGILHANLELHGNIPAMSTSRWQQSNGDILIYSGEWQQQDKARSLAEKLGIKSPPIKSYAFKQLEVRFRIDEEKTVINPVSIQRLGQQYRGQLLITTEGEITGQINQQDNQSAFTLSGEWPYFSLQHQ